MGLKKMLQQGLEYEDALLTKASKPAEPAKDETAMVEQSERVEAKNEPEPDTSTPKKSAAASTPKKKEKKNPGGRPTNKEKGILSRKQYTLTLKEDTYRMILEEAGKEELSFAKFMERAALEYINNHK